MGVKLDTIEGSAQYRKKIRDIELIMVERVCNPLMYYSIMFRLFSLQYNKHMKDIQSAHDFSSKIIDRKREEYNNNLQHQKAEENDRYVAKYIYIYYEGRSTFLFSVMCGIISTNMDSPQLVAVWEIF